MATDINAIKNLLITRINSNVTKLKELSDYPKDNFTGFPAACLFSSGNENQYASNVENLRTFLFEMYVFVDVTRAVSDPAHAPENAKKQAERLLGDVTSEILDTLDKYFDPQSGLDSTFEYLEAIPSAWEYVKVGIGLCRVARIDIKICKYYNVK